jgi:hypothetical protein
MEANSLDPPAGAAARERPSSDRAISRDRAPAAVPVEIRQLLGPGWILEGEDSDVFEKLLATVGHAVRPIDIIDWFYVMDVVELTWQIQRSRRYRESLMRSARHSAMAKLLDKLLPSASAPALSFSRNTPSKRLATEWLSGDKNAIERVGQLFAQAGYLISDVAARALSDNSAELERIDNQNVRHERRRDSLLLRIESRRTGWAKLVKIVSNEIVEGHFSELPSQDLPEKPAEEER